MAGFSKSAGTGTQPSELGIYALCPSLSVALLRAEVSTDLFQS